MIISIHKSLNMRLLILFSVVFEISSCTAPFIHGNIVYDHVSSSSNVVSKDSIYVSARILTPAEANTVFNGRYVQYDYTVSHTNYYTPITKMQTCVLSVLNNGKDTITFKAADTNNYIPREIVYNYLSDKTSSLGAIFISEGVICFVLAGTLSTPKVNMAPMMVPSGLLLLFSGIGLVASSSDKNIEIMKYIETISPDTLKLAPHQEKQIVVFRQNPLSPSLVDPNSDIFTENKAPIFVDKMQSDILKLKFFHENKKAINIEMTLKS